MVEESLKILDGRFAKMYSSYGRPGIPPEDFNTELGIRKWIAEAQSTIRRAGMIP
jgi:hypothetical protein